MQNISFFGRNSRIHWRCKSKGIHKLLRKQVNLIHIPLPKCLGCVSVIQATLNGGYSFSLRHVCTWWSSSKFGVVALMDGDMEMGIALKFLTFIGHHRPLRCWRKSCRTTWVAGSEARTFSSPKTLQMPHPGAFLSVSVVWCEFRETGLSCLWRPWGSVTTTLPDYKSNIGR